MALSIKNKRERSLFVLFIENSFYKQSGGADVIQTRPCMRPAVFGIQHNLLIMLAVFQQLTLNGVRSLS